MAIYTKDQFKAAAHVSGVRILDWDGSTPLVEAPRSPTDPIEAALLSTGGMRVMRAWRPDTDLRDAFRLFCAIWPILNRRDRNPARIALLGDLMNAIDTGNTDRARDAILTVAAQIPERIRP